MNILHISSNYPPEIGGPASSVPYLSKELIGKGHTAYVLTKDALGCSSYAVMDHVPVYRSRRVPGNFYNPVVAFTKALAMGVKARWIIKKHDIELVHSHDMNVSAIAGIIGSKLEKVKKITKFPGDLALETLLLRKGHGRSLEEIMKRQGIGVKFLTSVQKRICERYDKIIAPSKYMRRALLEYMEFDSSRVEVIYNGIPVYKYSDDEISELRKKLLGNKKYLLVSASRMVPWKGLEYLIDAFKMLSPGGRLILIGDGPSRLGLEKKARGLDVVFLGKIIHPRVQAYLRAADIFVLPSLYEPSALALLDCLAAQVPLVATSVGGTPEIITHEKTGLLVEAGRAEAIAESVNRLLSDAELYSEMRRNQRTALKRYLWENMINTYINFYKEIVNL